MIFSIVLYIFKSLTIIKAVLKSTKDVIVDVMNIIQDAIFESLGIDTNAETENNTEESEEGK